MEIPSSSMEITSSPPVTLSSAGLIPSSPSALEGCFKIQNLSSLKVVSSLSAVITTLSTVPSSLLMSIEHPGGEARGGTHPGLRSSELSRADGVVHMVASSSAVVVPSLIRTVSTLSVVASSPLTVMERSRDDVQSGGGSGLRSSMVCLSSSASAPSPFAMVLSSSATVLSLSATVLISSTTVLSSSELGSLMVSSVVNSSSVSQGVSSLMVGASLSTATVSVRSCSIGVRMKQQLKGIEEDVWTAVET
ncbi:hypothetical protein Bca101_082805 [Brassica carinata]